MRSSFVRYSLVLHALCAVALLAACGDSDGEGDGDVGIDDVLVIGDFGPDAGTEDLTADLSFDASPDTGDDASPDADASVTEDADVEDAQADADATVTPDADASDEPDETVTPDADAYDEPDETVTPDADAHDEPDATVTPDADVYDEPDYTVVPDADVYDEPDAAPVVCDCDEHEICAAGECVCRPGYVFDRRLGECVRERCRSALLYSDCGSDECVESTTRAIESLGVPVVHTVSDSAGFLAAVETGGFDLIVYNNSVRSMNDDDVNAIVAWVRGGGLLMFSYWNLDTSSTLAALFGVDPGDLPGPPKMHANTDLGIDVFDVVESFDADLLAPSGDLGDAGDILYTSDEDAIVLLEVDGVDSVQPMGLLIHGGRTVLNGFNEIDYYESDEDSDRVPDLAEIYANELQLLCGPTAVTYADRSGPGTPMGALDDLGVFHIDLAPASSGGLGIVSGLPPIDPAANAQAILSGVIVDLFAVDAGGNSALALATQMYDWAKSGGRFLVNSWRLDSLELADLLGLFGVSAGSASETWSGVVPTSRTTDLFDYVDTIPTPVECDGTFGDKQYPLVGLPDSYSPLAEYVDPSSVAVVQDADGRQILSGPLWFDCNETDRDRDRRSDALEIWVNQIVYVFQN